MLGTFAATPAQPAGALHRCSAIAEPPYAGSFFPVFGSVEGRGGGYCSGENTVVHWHAGLCGPTGCGAGIPGACQNCIGGTTVARAMCIDGPWTTLGSVKWADYISADGGAHVAESLLVGVDCPPLVAVPVPPPLP